MTCFKNIVFLVLGMLILSGCFGNTQKSIKEETAKLSIKSIAILPIETATDADVKDAQFLRTRIFEEIFFKGYPKISPEDVDQRLGQAPGNADDKTSSMPPQALTDKIDAETVMSCSLKKNTQYKLFYASTTADVSCVLRRTGTDDVVWKTQTHAAEKSFALGRKRLEIKAHEAVEPLINKILKKIMETLPDGPNFIH